MIKSLFFFLCLTLPLGGSLYASEEHSPFQANATVTTTKSIQIDGIVTLDRDNEYLWSDSDTYEALMDNNIRVYYSSSNDKNSVSYSINNMYAELMQHVEIDDLSGYFDFHLIGAGQTILMINEVNDYNKVIGYDYVNLNIEEKVESYSLQTVSPYYYNTKTLSLKLYVNDKNTIYDHDTFLYYYEGDKKILLLNTLDEDNQFQVFFDDKLSSFDSLTLYVSNGTITSKGIELFKKEVTFISYFDVINSNQVYLLSDNTAEFYVRIPKYSNPEFTLLENKNNIDLLSYEVSEQKDTYDIVTFKVKLNKADENFEVIIGSLTYDENGLYRRGYNYKSFHMTILEEIKTVKIISSIEERIGYGETVTFKASINEIEGVDCNLEWLLDDEVVYQGKQMTMNFKNSGNHVIKVRYLGVEDTLNVTVGYSLVNTILWYSGFFVLVVVGTIALVTISKKKGKNRKLFLPYKLPAEKTNKLMDNLSVQASVKEVDTLVRQMKILIDELGVYDISDESVSFESLIDNCKKELQVIQNFKTCPEDKKEMLFNRVKEKWIKIYALINDFTRIIQRKEGDN